MTRPHTHTLTPAVSGKDRVLAAIRFQRPGRIPVYTPGFDDGFVERWRQHKGLGQDAHPQTYYRHDTEIVIGDERFFPTKAGFLRREGDYDILDDGWGCTVRSQRGAYFTQVIDRMLKEPGDLDRITFDPPTLPCRYQTLDDQMRIVNENRWCGFSKIGGIYIRSQFMRGEENLLMDMASDEAFCDALFDKVTDHLCQMALNTLRRTGTYDTGLFVFDDMAGVTGPVFGPRLFARYLLPRYQRIIAACRAAGCRHFFFHSDGNVAPLIDVLLEAGFEGINPIEPRCNPDLIQLRRQYGERLVLIGGICNTRILHRNDPAEIEAHVRPLIELARTGGVVLGTASIPAEVAPEAYERFIQCVEEAD